MARKKSTKAALQMVEFFNQSLKHYEEVVKVKQLPIVNQANHIKEKSLDYYEGWIIGISIATEQVLHRENCYYGFNYVDSQGNWLSSDAAAGQYITAHPEYKSFRINYFIK